MAMPPTSDPTITPSVMNDECTVLTSARAFPARWTRVTIAGFIVTPTSPIPIMNTTAGTGSCAVSANPTRNPRFSTSPPNSTAIVCRSARRPTTVFPTTVAAPYATSSRGTVPVPKPVTSVRIGLR